MRPLESRGLGGPLRMRSARSLCRRQGVSIHASSTDGLINAVTDRVRDQASENLGYGDPSDDSQDDEEDGESVRHQTLSQLRVRS
jgi:hypothetical protein